MLSSRSAAAALAAVALVLPARASAHDPALRWYTVDTEHFAVNYHEGLGELAQRSARALEEAHRRLSPLLGHAPKARVQVVVSDASDQANGSASVLVRPVVELYAPPPENRSELNDYEDYVWNLVVHEYTHILHLDKVGGLPRVVNRVLGQVWTPNAIQPNWVLEGLAVWAESSQSGSGRERSSLYDMYLRAEVLEGRFFRLDEVTGVPSRWPWGTVAYLHGARFMEFLAERYGKERFAALSARYGSQLIPFGINAAARQELGRDFISLYGEWAASVRSKVEAQAASVRAAGLTPFTRLTRAGGWTGEPCFDPKTGRVVYLASSADRRAAIRAVERDGARDARRVEVYGNGGLALAPDGTWALISQTAPHREFYAYNDLFRVDFARGKKTRLTFGARLTEPDLSPDGKTAVAARHFPGGRMGIDEVSLETGAARALVPSQDSAVYTPRYSPDGKRVAFSEQTESGRQIFLVDRATGERQRVTEGRAMSLDPTFDPSGRWLLFSSDWSGIYNLYARDLSTGETRKVTNVLTGAFRPRVSQDSRALAFVTYTSGGYDVALMPFEPDRWPVADAQVRERPPFSPWDKGESYPVRAYRPLETLWPRYWMPILGSDPLGPAVGIATGGADVTGRHTWGLQAAWGFKSRQPAVDLGWTARVVYPELSAGLSSGMALQRTGLERQTAISLSASVPFTGIDWTSALFLGYELRHYAPISAPVPDGLLSDDLPPLRRGLAATATVGASFSDALRFTNSISAERGGSLSFLLRAARREIGSQYTSYSAQASASRFLALPWLSHHVLALRLAGGVAAGDLGGRSAFSLGGVGLRDPLLDLLFRSEAPSAALRGYRSGAFLGNRFALANAEVRAPIAAIDRGLWTLPIFLRRLHAAATFDYGLAADHLRLPDFRPSAGVELRADVVLGYALGLGLRLGYARGFGPGGIHEVFFGLGSGF
jgi:Tol biopolymer transport system component